MIDLAGKVAIVSGAASGIGEGTAELLAEANAAVVIADIDGEGAERVANAICVSGGVATAAQVDIAEEASVKGLFALIDREFGRLDILDNNAGLVSKAQVEADLDLASMDLEVWERSFAVNARGTMMMSREAVPRMIASGGGSIVNITSISGLYGDIRSTAYGSSKGAIIALTRYVATQHLADGIRCNAIAPGLVLTPASRAATLASDSGGGPVMQAMLRQMSRPGEPRDIGGVVLFLASDLSSYMTGQVLTVDGGFLMHSPAVPERAEALRLLGQSRSEVPHLEGSSRKSDPMAG